MNNSAQIHVLEVIIVAGMILTSLYFIRTFEFTPNIITTEENELELLGTGILANLEGVPDTLGEYNSLLARYVSEDEGYFSYKYDFIEYVDLSLPSGTLYEITRIDITEYSKHPEDSIKDHTEDVAPAAVKVGNAAVASRIVVIDGCIYEVVLTMYFTLR
ncbi:MAG: hypothetical protein KAW45_01700 [Thermoplasmatales archaeon]|nr:hypothetical protein [Thermoplasmatales archaeon]